MISEKYFKNVVERYHNLCSKNREILKSYKLEAEKINKKILNPEIQKEIQKEKIYDHINIDQYKTRKKFFDFKQNNHLQKTRKEQAVFQCIEMQFQQEKQSNFKDFKRLSSPLLGGFMITDLKHQYQISQHPHCTQFK